MRESDNETRKTEPEERKRESVRFQTVDKDAGKVDSHERVRLRGWLRRLGWVGILFFTAKGIVWLLIFWGAGSIIGC